MAKVQTRRSVSLSVEAYDAGTMLAAANGLSLASIVETILRERCGLPPNMSSAFGRRSKRRRGLVPKPVDINEWRRMRANANLAALERREHIARETRAIADETTAKADASKAEERERLAFDNPCRHPKCRRIEAHPEHAL